MISVSIVMPGFDRAQYPDLTLASLARQSFGDFEIVLVNHGAADHTEVVSSRQCMAYMCSIFSTMSW